MRFWCLLGIVLFLAFEKVEAATKAPCTFKLFELTFLEKIWERRSCELDIDEASDEEFTISSARDTDTLAFLMNSKKGVKFLPQNMFGVLPNLELIQVFNCSVSSISENHFKSLSRLEKLILARNKIEIIASDAFIDLVNLEYLTLWHNRIRSLRKDTFVTLQALKFLHLNDNEIQFLHPKVFASLVNIEEISFDNNEINFLDENVFENQAKLKRIFIADNKLHEIPRNLFKNNTKLEGVWLRGNKIKFIDGGTFRSLPVLAFVNVRQNLCIDQIYLASEYESMEKDFKQKCSKNSTQEKLENAMASFEKLEKKVEELQTKLNGESEAVQALKTDVNAMEQDLLQTMNVQNKNLSDQIDAVNETFQSSPEIISISKNNLIAIFLYFIVAFFAVLILVIAYSRSRILRSDSEARAFAWFKN